MPAVDGLPGGTKRSKRFIVTRSSKEVVEPILEMSVYCWAPSAAAVTKQVRDRAPSLGIAIPALRYANKIRTLNQIR